MSKSDLVNQFLEVVGNPTKKIDEYIKILVNPRDQIQLKLYSKAIFFAIIHSLREEYNKTNIIRIAQFIIMAIMTGHLHILCLINKYLLPQLVQISRGVLKFTPLSPTKSNLGEVEASKWRIQFASQILYLLSEWFPIDFINNGQSKYLEIVRSRKILIKAYFLFNYQFIRQMDKALEGMNLQEGNICVFCVKCYEKLGNGNRQKIKIKLNKDYNKQIVTLSPVCQKSQQIYQKIKAKKNKSIFIQNENNTKDRQQQDRYKYKQKLQINCQKISYNSSIIQRIRDNMTEKKKKYTLQSSLISDTVGQNSKQMAQNHVSVLNQF